MIETWAVASRARRVHNWNMSNAPIATHVVDYDEASPVASPEERIEFLKQSIAFTESTIRSYDTKSQIALAAFVLSMNPLWSILNATCNNIASRPIVAVLLCGFICTILSYCFVLWPIRPLQDLPSMSQRENLVVGGEPPRLGQGLIPPQARLIEIAEAKQRSRKIYQGRHVNILRRDMITKTGLP